MEENEAKRILNIGCGNDMYGTDRIDLFKTPATTAVVNLDKEDLPYENETFDEILASGVLEHLKNIGHFEEEIFRVLKKGGVINLLTDSATYIFWHVLKRWEHNEYLNHYYQTDEFKHTKNKDAHRHLFVKSHLKHLFSRFEKVDIKYVAHGRNFFILFIANNLPFNWGKRQVVVKAIK